MKNLLPFLNREDIYSPKDAYNIWADTYDIEKNNLMLFYDKIILLELISKVDLKGKVILDYGCGTGRNWPLFQKNEPAQIIGCDISSQMLEQLKSKYVNANAYLIDDNRLPFLNNAQCDIIVSTLVIAHVKKVKDMFTEWIRVIRESSDIIITDFHPALLSIGGSRTFKHFDKSITIKNFVHEIVTIEKLLSSCGFKTVKVIEKKIDEEVKHFYVNQNALSVYDKFKNVPFIYGIHMSRRNDFK